MNLENLKRILRINSEEQPAVPGCPFGVESARCLDEMLKIGSEMGFEVKNVDNYGGHIEWKSERAGETKGGKAEAEGAEPKLFAIFGHLDVVPAGNGWDYNPYGAEVHDGYLYGRGTTDDKGPMMICLEAMKELKDEGFKPKHDIRLILGCDEETNWNGVDYYFAREKRPDFGFTPDAEFPIINGEKGIMHLAIARKFDKTQVQGLELRSIKGGTAPNAVCQSCRAVIRSDKGYDKVREVIDNYKTLTDYQVNYKAVGKSFEIVTTGIAAHGAKPELGLNACSIMMDLLGKLNFVNEDHNEFIQFYNDHIGFETNGESMGLKMEDEASGALTLNVGIIELTAESGRFTLDIRYPVTKSAQDVQPVISELIGKYDLGMIMGKVEEPIYFPKDEPFITELLGIYKKYSGDSDAEPITMGGGTYARATKGIVAFGAQFPEDEDRMHQANERISLERIEQIFEIYKEAIYKLASSDYN